MFAPGEAVVREGEASIALYVVARGEAVVVHAGQEVARVGEGEVFGEMAFLSGAPRAATVRAAAALAVVEVDSRALTALLAERRGLAEELANRMASRLQELAAREAIAAVARASEGPRELPARAPAAPRRGMRRLATRGYTLWRWRGSNSWLTT